MSLAEIAELHENAGRRGGLSLENAEDAVFRLRLPKQAGGARDLKLS